jgi:hypothetical protein
MRLLGVPVRLGWSWLLVPVFAVLAARSRGLDVLGVFLLLGPGTVLVHELGHLLVARRFGIHAEQLDLGLLEGRVWLPQGATVRQQRIVLIAGPAAQAAWGCLWLGLSLVGGWEPAPGSLAAMARGASIFALLWAAANLRPFGQSDGALLLASFTAANPHGRWRVWMVAGCGAFMVCAGGYLVAATHLWPVGGLFVFGGLIAQVGAWSLWREG